MTYTSILQISDRLFQCPRHALRGDLVEKNLKGIYEKSSIDIISKSVRIWRSIIASRILLPTIGRDTPNYPYCLWRNSNF